LPSPFPFPATATTKDGGRFAVRFEEVGMKKLNPISFSLGSRGPHGKRVPPYLFS